MDEALGTRQVTRRVKVGKGQGNSPASRRGGRSILGSVRHVLQR